MCTYFTWCSDTYICRISTEESWDDFPVSDEWQTEEYTGSLTETKVFTPSAQIAAQEAHAVAVAAAAAAAAAAGTHEDLAQQQEAVLGSPPPPVRIGGGKTKITWLLFRSCQLFCRFL